ncbi:hypothetical protein JOD44_002105 [Salimicrobium jeotgali]|nr:hypothetical protein [Salimicrobium jeotgali]
MKKVNTATDYAQKYPPLIRRGVIYMWGNVLLVVPQQTL